MISVWDDLTAAIWHPDRHVATMRAQYAFQRAFRVVLESHLDHIRRHVATYAVWQCGRIDPDALADSLCDHLRDVTPLPVDAVEELLP